MTHTVQKGENLYIIAKKYNTTVKQLMELNHLHNTLIKIGQKLIISKKDLEENNIISYEEFLKNNIGVGTLKIQTLIGDTYFPIENVKIEIFKTFHGKKQIFFSGFTEKSGLIDAIELPAPLKREDYLNGVAIYQIEATHPSYQKVLIEEVYLYDGIKSIQKIEMMPLSYQSGKGL